MEQFNVKTLSLQCMLVQYMFVTSSAFFSSRWNIQQKLDGVT